MNSNVTVFVFGSNLAGRHGAGAALYAYRHYGAQLGVGVGRTGNSYAIPTKDAELRTLSLDVIANHIINFVEYALRHPKIVFEVTRVGCGLAGYKDEDIAPLFDLPVPKNCIMPACWSKFYKSNKDASLCECGYRGCEHARKQGWCRKGS